MNPTLQTHRKLNARPLTGPYDRQQNKNSIFCDVLDQFGVAMNELAASATSPEGSSSRDSSRLLAQPPRRPNQGNQDPGERLGGGSAGGRRPQGALLGLGFLDLVFGEAALAADLVIA